MSTLFVNDAPPAPLVFLWYVLIFGQGFPGGSDTHPSRRLTQPCKPSGICRPQVTQLSQTFWQEVWFVVSLSRKSIFTTSPSHAFLVCRKTLTALTYLEHTRNIREPSPLMVKRRGSVPNWPCFGWLRRKYSKYSTYSTGSNEPVSHDGMSTCLYQEFC